MTNQKNPQQDPRTKKRKPRWDRILTALAFAVLCIGGAVVLPRWYDASAAANAGQSDSAAGTQSAGLADGPATGTQGQSASSDPAAEAAGGHVVSFTDPGVDLSGLHDSETGVYGAAANDRYAFFSLPTEDCDPATNPSHFALARYDNTTRAVGWLCDVPGCDHQDPATCPAWLPIGAGLYLDGEDLYLLDWSLAEDAAVTLYRCALDGGDRRELAHLAGDWSLEAVSFCEEAVLLVVSPVEDGFVQNTQQFYVYNKAEGTLQLYMTTENCRYPYLYDDLLVASDDGVYFAVDLATGQERELYEAPGITFVEMGEGQRDAVRQPVGERLYEGALYYLREKDGEYCDLVRQNVATGEETVLNDHVFFPYNYTAGIHHAASLQDGCYEYCIGSLANGEENIEYTVYCLDLATGEQMDPPTPIEERAYCTPIALFDEYCLVNLPYAPPNDGLTNQRDFCLITREDLEAGRKEYLPVQNDLG